MRHSKTHASHSHASRALGERGFSNIQHPTLTNRVAARVHRDTRSVHWYVQEFRVSAPVVAFFHAAHDIVLHIVNDIAEGREGAHRIFHIVAYAAHAEHDVRVPCRRFHPQDVPLHDVLYDAHEHTFIVFGEGSQPRVQEILIRIV